MLGKLHLLLAVLRPAFALYSYGIGVRGCSALHATHSIHAAQSQQAQTIARAAVPLLCAHSWSNAWQFKRTLPGDQQTGTSSLNMTATSLHGRLKCWTTRTAASLKGPIGERVIGLAPPRFLAAARAVWDRARSGRRAALRRFAILLLVASRLAAPNGASAADMSAGSLAGPTTHMVRERGSAAGDSATHASGQARADASRLRVVLPADLSLPDRSRPSLRRCDRARGAERAQEAHAHDTAARATPRAGARRPHALRSAERGAERGVSRAPLASVATAVASAVAPSATAELVELEDAAVELQQWHVKQLVLKVKGTAEALALSINEVRAHVSSTERDTIVLLATAALVTPVMGRLKLSPVLGFLFAGMALGPSALGLVSDVVTTTKLAEFGVVFFLFEMGLELELERLKSVGRDAFRMGGLQVALCAVLYSSFARLVGLNAAAAVVLGGAFALSSSAFVIQLLSEKGELATRFGRASFGILLFQDLAVVPLLVVTPLLGGPSAQLGAALRLAAVKSVTALSLIGVAGRFLLQPVFKIVASAKDQTAFLAITLLTVISMSAFTQALGLSDTLGAFLAGVLLAETKYRFQIEADIAPFRGLLLGLFFITTGFSIDVPLALANAPVVLGLALGLHISKTALVLLVCMINNLKFSAALRTGLLLSQGGEFAFVLFGLAQNHGILPAPQAHTLVPTRANTRVRTHAKVHACEAARMRGCMHAHRLQLHTHARRASHAPFAFGGCTALRAPARPPLRPCLAAASLIASRMHHSRSWPLRLSNLDE
uniref:Cation/H+ exchanger transmembrane domain-containing protein n=1 Tax=Chrysotila carterae TaxID=13221 RepID=A0A7S4B0S9_CHRCT